MINEIEIRKSIINALKEKTDIKNLKDLKDRLYYISEVLRKWNLELDYRFINYYEKCHICRKLLGYPFYWSDNFIEIYPVYYCNKCDYILCKECGEIHKKNHIDERRLEIYKAKKIYRRNKLRNKANRNNNKNSKQLTILSLIERQNCR
jgi:hypothetical protein